MATTTKLQGSQGHVLLLQRVIQPFSEILGPFYCAQLFLAFAVFLGTPLPAATYSAITLVLQGLMASRGILMRDDLLLFFAAPSKLQSKSMQFTEVHTIHHDSHVKTLSWSSRSTGWRFRLQPMTSASPRCRALIEFGPHS